MRAVQTIELAKAFEAPAPYQSRSSTLRTAWSRRLPWGLMPSQLRARRETARERRWALRGVSLAIERGEAVGLVGPNGAGKTTLLKILARITTPTEGRLTVNGRVVPLLGVGAGFHPDLSGRENIFLLGAVLGMKRASVLRHFDSLVDFAQVEDLLDVAVKHYSAGMYVRLAFSIAVHLDSEILLVDEALSVGDLNFRKRCLDKLSEIVWQGRSVLLVTHELDAVRQICARSYLLVEGRIADTGETARVLETYRRSCRPTV